MEVAKFPVWRGRRYILSDEGLDVSVFADSAVQEEKRAGLRLSSDWDLDPATDAVLRKCHPSAAEAFRNTFKFSQLTPIQRVVVPVLLEEQHRVPSSLPAADVVITAPTGQGKTLCYALPIVSSLFYFATSRLRGLLIAPTRELVTQIAKVFTMFTTPSASSSSNSSQFRVCVLAGVSSFSQESLQLRGAEPSYLSNQVDDVHRKIAEDGFPTGVANIVVATPGRFVEHYTIGSSYSAAAVLYQVKGSTARHNDSMRPMFNGKEKQEDGLWRHLEWIVMDEVDRLLDQNYQNWIAELNRLSTASIKRPRRIVAAATMTQNPEHLFTLNLVRPLYFSTTSEERSYTVPITLRQKWVLSPALSTAFGSSQAKPLVLLYLLHQLYTPSTKGSGLQRADIKTIVFCSSKRKALEVSSLINCHFGRHENWDTMFPPKIHSYDLALPEAGTGNPDVELDCTDLEPFSVVAKHFSADLSQLERARLLFAFGASLTSKNAESIDILVGSDVLGRGLDVMRLDVVVNYDCPSNLPTYIHRVGRTARAGRRGVAFTLVTVEELPSFKQMLKRNKLPQSQDALPDSLTLWDIVHKHSIFPEHLVPWISTTALEERSSDLSEDHLHDQLTPTGRKASYYSKLLEYIASSNT